MGASFDHLIIWSSLLQIILATNPFCSSNNNSGPSDGASPWKSLLSQSYNFMDHPPKLNEQTPHKVYVALDILNIDEINEAQMTFSMQFYYIEAWEDSRLMTENLDRSWIFIPDDAYKCFWTPDTVFDTSKQKHIFDASSSILTIFKNRTVLRTVRCRMDLSRYPMDTQNCLFRARVQEPASLVYLNWMDDPESPYKDLVPWSVKMSRSIKPYDFIMSAPNSSKKNRHWLTQSFSYVQVDFTFTRRFISSLVTTYIPSFLTMAVSWISFWMKVEAPGRTAIGIMSILTIMTQILDVRRILPNVAYITAIDIWLFACLFNVFLTIIEYAVAYTLVRKVKQGEQLKWKNILESMKAQSWFNTNIVKDIKKDDHDEEENNPPAHSTDNNLANNLDNICKWLFPLIFLIFTLIYWSIYLSLDSPSIDEDT